MYLPTRKHEEYIEYMKRFCDQNHLSLVLGGSLADGTAKPFSDIDLILSGSLDTKLIDEIITGFDDIVMTNFTENPSGIYILNYRNGISVDLDIRESVLKSEIDNKIILCNYGFKIAEEIKRISITNSYMLERPQWYKTIRLIHRCCIKYLCGKADAAEELANEVGDAVYTLTNKKVVKCISIRQRMEDSFHFLNQNYYMENSIIELLETLFREMDYVI